MDHPEIRMLTARPFSVAVQELARRFLLKGTEAQANKFTKADIENLLLEIWRRQQRQMELEDSLRIAMQGPREISGSLETTDEGLSRVEEMRWRVFRELLNEAGRLQAAGVLSGLSDAPLELMAQKAKEVARTLLELEE
jgi:hypothetical protein